MFRRIKLGQNSLVLVIVFGAFWISPLAKGVGPGDLGKGGGHAYHPLERIQKMDGSLNLENGVKLAFEIENSPTLPRIEPSPVKMEPPAHGINLVDKDGWNVIFSGIVEMDVFSDSTRSFAETIGNAPVETSGSSNGANGRTQFSIRNSRLAFGIQPPHWGGWKTKGYFETDFLGFDPAPPGASGSTNSEASFFNNPTLRVRHAYIQGNSGGFQLLLGQTWQLFGWQPYYFMSTAQVAPVAAMLYGRTAQIRAMETFLLGDDFGTLQVAAAVVRPAQRDGLYPDLQAGVRLAFNGRTAAFTGGSAGSIKNQPASLGVSGLARYFIVPGSGTTTGNVGFVGSALAFDTMLPVIASSDGKETANTLSLLGEYTFGAGYGDQFVGWTGNMASPLSASRSTLSTNVNLDPGIGDYDSSGTFNLANLSTFNVHLQYHLPQGWQTFINLGIGQLFSSNMGALTPRLGLTSGSKVPYFSEAVGFFNIFHDFSDQIRVGVEFAHTETIYSDGGMGYNNRYQLTSQFIF